jgi:polar amino acid transport system substrate-binding protein
MTIPARLPVGLAALATAVALTLTGCAGGTTRVLPSAPPASPSSSAAAPSASPLPGCSDDNSTRVASYRPDGALPSALQLPPTSTMAKIKQRGRLIVGVSADKLLFGFRDPISGKLEGFDIDMVDQVANAIFGTTNRRVEYRVVTSAQRIPALSSDQVDLVADTMTINCARWSQAAFSAEYFHAGQQILVRKDSAATGIVDLDGKKVCSATGSTGSENLKKYPRVVPVLVNAISDCMVLFQQGSVDGIISDNTSVAGFEAQDPYAKVVGPRITDEPYGLAMPKHNRDFVKFVNALLARLRADGTWKQIYSRWITGPVPNPPTPVYGR